MSASRWQRLQDLFDGALELPASRREAWLAAQEVDADLRDEVLALVATHDSQNESFTSRLGAIADAVVQQPAAGTRLGPYVLIGVFVIGMLLTPPDVFSQTLLAIPMWLLFELGLLVSRYARRPSGVASATRPDAAG